MNKEYKGVTHTIVELLSRKKIQAVPRNKDTKRTELDKVGRPDDDRKNSEVPTRQQEIQKKIIDETWADEMDKKSGKFKKGDRVLHVGGWPGMVAGPQHKWKPPKGTITGTHEHKGELIHSIKVDGQKHENWGHPRDFKKVNETKIAQLKKPVDGVKGPKKLDITDVGKQPPTKVEVNPELEKTNVFNSTELKGEPLTEGDRATIQYQSDSGVWITAQKTINTPSNILTAMTQVQKAHDTNRVRAIDARGSLVDMLAQQPVQFQPAQLPFGKLTTPQPTFRNIDFPERKERVTFGRALGMWLTGEETQIDEGGVPSIGKTAATSGISAAMFGIKKAYPKTAEAIDKLQTGLSDATKFVPGYATFAAQKDVLPAKMVTDYIEKNRAKKETKAEETIYRALDRIIEARHSGIETDEPKFSQSIQKVAAHAKTYADVEHTYKHKDGSKTRVNQELGEKIHRTIHSTPHRHRADLIQKMHSSAGNLKHALKEGKTYKATKRSGEAKALENPVFRNRIVKNKTAYTRKKKHKGKGNE